MYHKLARLAFIGGLGLLLLPAWCPSLGAATHTVTDLGDNGSPGQLRSQMNAAAPGDTIIVPAGTITLTGAAGEDLNASGDLDVVKNVIIQGAGPGLTIIDGGLVDGVFDILAARTLTLSGVTIRNGISVQAGGGGIRNFGTVHLAHAIVSGNEAARGAGGIRNDGGGIRNLGAMTLTDVVVTGNISRGNGAGIYNELGGAITLGDVTVSANHAQLDGAGIYNKGAATLTNVTVSGNNADTNAGGIFTGGLGATATLTNVTVSGNLATSSGGGIFNSATLALTNVTMSGNTANFSGGGIINFGPATIKNVILSVNTDPIVPGTANCSGTITITSLGHNLEQGNTCALTQPGDLPATDPKLGPLQNNGGLTFTQALLAGSPAIDAGTNAGCPATDQRGVARGLCDIGAYESATGAPAPILVILPASLSGATVGTFYSQTLTLGVSNGVLYTPPSPSFSVTASSLPAGLGLATGVLSGTPTTAGTFNFTIGATDANGFSASQAYTLTIPAAKAASTTTFTSTAPASLAYGQTYTPVATSTGDGSLTIGVSGSCSIAGGVVTITSSSGACTITAVESEGPTHLGSSATPQSINAAKATSTTTFTSTAPASLPFGQTYAPAATSTGDGSLTIGASGSCSIAGGVVTITSGSGVCTITAVESEGSNHLGSSATPQSIAAAKANATVTVNSISVAYDGLPHSVTASTTPSSLSVSFTYNGSVTPPTQPGAYAVVGTIQDPNYQGSGAGTLTITTSLDALRAQVENLNLNGGNKNSLRKKLEAAQDSLEGGNRNAAANQLGAFINEVQALQRSGRLDASTAASLIAQATSIIQGMVSDDKWDRRR